MLLAFAPPLLSIEPSTEDQLLHVKRIYVDKLDGDLTALQMRDMIIAALQQTHLFLITEDEDRADASLRGSSTDVVFTDQHSSSDGIHANVNASTGSSAYKGGSFNKSAGAGLSESESSHSIERKHEATAAVRLVNKDGDVIWSTTAESLGGKFKGSMADVADKLTRQLADAVTKARAAKPRVNTAVTVK